MTPEHEAAVAAIRSGDVGELQRLVTVLPDLVRVRVASASVGDNSSRSLLHVATDWPGHFPNSGEIIRVLVEAGADVDERFVGPHRETPLHWAASSGDLAALDALLDLGADIEADGAVVGGGTPLSDAAGFGQWAAARRLIERGATATLWEAAALGLIDRVSSQVITSPPSGEEVTHAFWCACHGGQVETATFLLGIGADLNWVGHDQLTPLEAAERGGSDSVVQWLLGLGALRAADRHD